MKSHIWIVAFTAILVVYSCTTQPPFTDNMSAQPEHQSPKVPELHINEFMSTEACTYQHTDETTDFLVLLSSLKPSPIEEEQITALSDQLYYHSTKTIANLGKPFDILVDGIPVNHVETIKKTTKTPESIPNYKQLYGKTVSYKFIPITSTKGTQKESITIAQYVPELIEITSPRVSNEDEMYPVCYGGNFILRWNADPKNTDGLIVTVDWSGEKMFGPSYDNQSVSRTAFIPEDNGEFRLDPKMFDHIPNTALVFITLLRGNSKTALVGDFSYRMYCETHAVLPIILCRKMRTI